VRHNAAIEGSAVPDYRGDCGGAGFLWRATSYAPIKKANSSISNQSKSLSIFFISFLRLVLTFSAD
jgi:hypothetical protein